MNKLIPTILCGGAGSRLWPVSREMHPKPFIRLADGQSLLQKAFLRGATLPNVKEILTITNRELYFKTEDDYSEVNQLLTSTSFILEPFGRNTAAAIAAAVLHVIQTYGENSLLLVLAADHLITDHTAFTAAVANAVELAKQGKIVTFGIQPDAPETGFGYIEAKLDGKHLSQDQQLIGYDVLSFVEKPSQEKAQEYMDSGRFFWNSGMFCFSANVMLKELELLCPEVLKATSACLEQSYTIQGSRLSPVELSAESFSKVPDVSIDYAVMEKSDKVAVVQCNIGWSDIGSWSALGDLIQPDANGNRVEGETLLVGSKNCYIQSNTRIVAAVGVDDLIIVDTPDALLVASRAQSQNVKHVYAELKLNGHDAHKLHKTAHRPWGTYTVLEEGERFKIKRIVVKPGASLSLQMHHHRSEHWVVVSGIAKVVNGENVLYVNTNESTFIPPGHAHRLENTGLLDLVLIEVQSGDYLGEDDIVRFEDNYGRVTN